MFGRVGVMGVSALLAASNLDTCQTNELGNLRAKPGGDLSYIGLPSDVFGTRHVEACGRGGVRIASDFIRQPYLQKVDTSSMELLWVAETTDDFRVEITLPDGTPVTSVKPSIDGSAKHDEGTRQYVARIEGLPAATTICYRVLSGASQWTNWSGASTAPSDTSARIRFAALGDLGTGSSDQLAVLDQMEQIDYDFVVLAGDIAYDDGKRSELQRNVFDIYAELMQTVPFFPASGNHDYATEDAAPFREAFALFENGGPEGKERWYSFDWGPVHFVVLDTEKIGDPQTSWLEADLAAADRPWTIAVAHRPPYSSGDHGSDDNVRRQFNPIFERHDVDVVITGHDHHYERIEAIRGVTYVVTGGGGRGTRPVGQGDYTVYADDVAHFVVFEVDGSTLRMVAVDATGQQFDSLRIQQ